MTKRKRVDLTMETDLPDTKFTDIQTKTLSDIKRIIKNCSNDMYITTYKINWTKFFEGHNIDGELKNHPLILHMDKTNVKYHTFLHSGLAKFTFLDYCLDIWTYKTGSVLSYLFEKGYVNDIDWVYERYRNKRCGCIVTKKVLRNFFAIKPSIPIDNEWELKLKIYYKYYNINLMNSMSIPVNAMIARQIDIETFVQTAKNNGFFKHDMVSSVIANLSVNDIVDVEYKRRFFEFLLEHRVQFNAESATSKNEQINRQISKKYKSLVLSHLEKGSYTHQLMKTTWDSLCMVKKYENTRIYIENLQNNHKRVWNSSGNMFNMIDSYRKSLPNEKITIELDKYTYESHCKLQTAVAKAADYIPTETCIHSCLDFCKYYFTLYNTSFAWLANFIRTCKTPLMWLCNSATDVSIWSTILMYVACSPFKGVTHKISFMDTSIIYKMETLLESYKIYMLDKAYDTYIQNRRLLTNEVLDDNPCYSNEYCNYMLKRIVIPKVLTIIYNAMKEICPTPGQWDIILDLNKDVIKKGQDTIIELTKPYTHWIFADRIITHYQTNWIHVLQDELRKGRLYKMYSLVEEITKPSFNLDDLNIMPGFDLPVIEYVVAESINE